jgi:hypothetical protein
MRDHLIHFASTRRGRAARLAMVLAAVAATSTLAACKDFLTARNPGAIEAPRLEDAAMVDLMANSAVGEFQPLYPWLVYYSAIYVDELRNHHVFAEEGLFDQRRVFPDNGTYSFFLYTPLHRARWLADSVTGRIRAIEGDSATRDLRVARSYAFAGYSLVMLAEMLCEAPLSTSSEKYSRPYKPEELFQFATQRFDSAVKIAAAAKAGAEAITPRTTDVTRAIAGADSVRNLALIGSARASLGRNDAAKAISYAQLVTPMTNGDFEFRLYYLDNQTNRPAPAQQLWNYMQERVSGGGGLTTGSISGTPFLGLDDARVPYPQDAAGTAIPEATQSGSWVVPNSSESWSSFNNTKSGADYTRTATARLASLLEAKYIIAEAGGAAGTNLGGQSNIAFIESRRTAFPSTTAATPTTAANYMTNLMEQRRRDFFLDGHRMGDLRRWKRYNSVDSWQKGTFYGSTTINFADNTCWPLTTAEFTNNPFVPKPYVQPTGP